MPPLKYFHVQITAKEAQLMTYLQAMPSRPLFFAQTAFFNFLVPPWEFLCCYTLCFFSAFTLTAISSGCMTAVQNRHHSVSTSSVKTGSSLNLNAVLLANAVCTSFLT